MRQSPVTAERVVQQTHIPKPVVVSFAHLDPLALGVALGLISGLWIAAVTLILVIRGGEVVGPNLWLLAQYFIGYSVTAIGSLIGFVYAFLIGFLFGFAFAFLRNRLNHLYLMMMVRRAERHAIDDLL